MDIKCNFQATMKYEVFYIRTMIYQLFQHFIKLKLKYFFKLMKILFYFKLQFIDNYLNWKKLSK